jgi:hypothetical protein
LISTFLTPKVGLKIIIIAGIKNKSQSSAKKMEIDPKKPTLAIPK